MIHLDERHTVGTAEDVAAISPMFMSPSPEAKSDAWVADPCRCKVHLRDGSALVVNASVAHVRAALEQIAIQTGTAGENISLGLGRSGSEFSV